MDADTQQSCGLFQPKRTYPNLDDFLVLFEIKYIILLQEKIRIPKYVSKEETNVRRTLRYHGSSSHPAIFFTGLYRQNGTDSAQLYCDKTYVTVHEELTEIDFGVCS